MVSEETRGEIINNSTSVLYQIGYQSIFLSVLPGLSSDVWILIKEKLTTKLGSISILLSLFTPRQSINFFTSKLNRCFIRLGLKCIKFFQSPLKKIYLKDRWVTHMQNQLSENYIDSISNDVMCIGEVFLFSAKSTMFLFVPNEVTTPPCSSITLSG